MKYFWKGDYECAGPLFMAMLCIILPFNCLCLYWIDRAAAAAMSKRNADGSLPLEDYVIELEDQGGRQVKLGSETDQQYDAY